MLEKQRLYVLKNHSVKYYNMIELKEDRHRYENTCKSNATEVYTSGREDRRNRRKTERSSKRKKIKPLV